MPPARRCSGISPPAPAISCSPRIRSAPRWRWRWPARAGRPSARCSRCSSTASAARRSTTPTRRRIATLNGYDKSDRPPTCPPGMSSSGERCEAKPTAAGNCPFPANRARRSLRGDAELSAVGQASGRQCTDAGGVPTSPRTTRRCSRTATRRKCSERASLDTVNGWVKQRTEGKIEQDPRKDVRRGAGQRGLFQIALGGRLRQEAHQERVLQPDAQPPGDGPDHAAAGEPRRGGARGLSRDPAALCGALAGHGDRAAERGRRAWRRRAPSRRRRTRANARRAAKASRRAR